jgi:hypothetical protein
VSERHDIVLREADGSAPNPPGVIAEIREMIKEVFPDVAADATQSGLGWLRGKSQQESAKAMEIRASAIEKLGNLEIQRQKLINEREEIYEKAQTEREQNEHLNKQKMFDLKTQRFKAVIESLKLLKESGAELSARTMKKLEAGLLELVDPSES